MELLFLLMFLVGVVVLLIGNLKNWKSTPGGVAAYSVTTVGLFGFLYLAFWGG